MLTVGHQLETFLARLCMPCSVMKPPLCVPATATSFVPCPLKNFQCIVWELKPPVLTLALEWCLYLIINYFILWCWGNTICSLLLMRSPFRCILLLSELLLTHVSLWEMASAASLSTVCFDSTSLSSLSHFFSTSHNCHWSYTSGLPCSFFQYTWHLSILTLQTYLFATSYVTIISTSP